MNNIQAKELKNKFSKMAHSYARERGFLPASIEEDDLVQEALCKALECESRFLDDGRAKFSSYLSKPVLGHWSNIISKSYFGPSAQVKSYRKKKGIESIDYGEVSIEVIASDGSDWLESIASEENCEAEISFFNLTMQEAADCLIDIRRQIKTPTDTGIAWAKTRSKYHVTVKVCGRNQFVGQFKTIEDSRAAKIKFLESFMDAVLAAIEED
jgi:DNA-directed RNA polymerase specialized sigma24 family protein